MLSHYHFIYKNYKTKEEQTSPTTLGEDIKSAEEENYRMHCMGADWLPCIAVETREDGSHLLWISSEKGWTIEHYIL